MLSKIWIKFKNFLKILSLLFINILLVFFPDKKDKSEKINEEKNKKALEKSTEKKREQSNSETSNTNESRSLFEETYVKEYFTEEEIKEKIQKAFEKETKFKIQDLERKENYKETEKKVFKKIQEKKYRKDEKQQLDSVIQIEVKKEAEKFKEKPQEIKNESINLDEAPVILKKENVSVLKNLELETENEEIKEDENKNFHEREEGVLEIPSKKEVKQDDFIEENLQIGSEIPENVEEPVFRDISQNPDILPLASTPVVMRVNQILEEEMSEEKQYDHLEEKIALRETQLRVFLKEELDEAKKEQAKNELKKIEVLKKDMNEQKELVLDEEIIQLEEKIPLKEKELVLTELKDMQDKQVKEMEEEIFKEFENKSEEYIKNMEKILVKERIQSLARGIEIPMLLSFPFIKNSYFRIFTASLFLHNHLSFLRNLLWRTPRNYLKSDLSSLDKGKDALKKSQDMIAKNILLFSQIEQNIFSKYPELQEDEEFLNQLDDIKVRLLTDYYILKRKEEKINQNLEKIKGQTRKLKKWQRRENHLG